MTQSQPALAVKRHSLHFSPDARRVVLRPFFPTQPGRLAHIVSRVEKLTEEQVESQLAVVLTQFADRHADLQPIFLTHFDKVCRRTRVAEGASAARRLLLGSYVTGEYALESAALFNPSIMPHPDQSGLAAGEVRVIMSFRATGEGHISSIEFRSGILRGPDDIVLDDPGRLVTTPAIEPNPSYHKALFERKLTEMRISSAQVLDPLPEMFSLIELLQRLKEISSLDRRTDSAIRWLAESNYQVHFPATVPIAERIIFPVSPSESNGIEDARFVRFVDDDGHATWYATYTAYNGRTILPSLLETTDFLTFNVRTLNGRAVQNKGMALFPRKLNGRYAMIARQDNENLFLMYSDHLHFWSSRKRLLKPRYPWEFVQIGNCGSPIETEAGWLLLTHGVGPMRRYCIGAILLDKEEPSRVLGRLETPLLEPTESERNGYVPNVVYTCGALVHGRQLIIPYAMSDSASSIATVSLDALLTRLQSRAQKPLVDS